jgi:Zn-finger nucleic acid-binding protein
VVREQLKAEADGNTVVRQNVQIHTAVCPECGRVYVSGGTTTTVTRSEPPTRRGRNIEIEV